MNGWQGFVIGWCGFGIFSNGYHGDWFMAFIYLACGVLLYNISKEV